MCKLIDKKQPLPSDEAGPSAPKMKRRCFYCPSSNDKKALLYVSLAKKVFASHIQQQLPIVYHANPKNDFQR